MAKSKEKKPKLEFEEEVLKELANSDDRHHIKDLEPSITEAFLKHSKYTDKNGVTRYKQKFNKKEGAAMGNGIYDALGYHSHRRVFGIDKKTYETLKKFKDGNGNPYIDSVIQHHFPNLPSRKQFVKSLSKYDKNNINVSRLQRILKEPIEGHIERINQGIISKSGLDDPKHMNKIKKTIDKIVKKFDLKGEQYDTSKMYSPQEVMQTYLSLAQYYTE